MKGRVEQELTVERLADSDPGRFFDFHCDRHHSGFCFCVAWYVESWDDWEQRSSEQNRTLREDLFARGVRDGYLAFLPGEQDPVAWCQAAPRDSIPRLGRQFGLVPDPGSWAIGCLLVRPEFRGKGIARAVLRRVLEELKQRGAERVEAFPLEQGDHPADELWNGPLALYRELGFELVKPGSPRLVVARELV